MKLYSCEDIVNLLNFYLPRADADEEAVLEPLERRHRARQAAIDSAHRKQARPKPKSQSPPPRKVTK